MTILLVWENVPESTDLYAIEEGTEQAKWAEASAGLYINGDTVMPGDPIDKLQNWLLEGQNASKHLAVGPFSKAIVCGFIL